MSEYIDNQSRRQEALKRMIRRLHAGERVEDVKAEFAALLTQVDATEIAALEQALIAEGMPATEIKRLCDVHVAAFRDSLNAPARPAAIPVTSIPIAADRGPGHPVNAFRAGNAAAAQALDALEAAIRDSRWEQARDLLRQLRQHEKHYARKENVLFPYLEKHGLTGPSAVMWAIHDDIRAGWKQLDAQLAGSPDAAGVAKVFGPLATAIREMFYKEENILFPAALQRLSQEEWAAIGAHESEAAPAYTPAPGGAQTGETAVPPAEGLIPLQTGALTARQIALLLTHLPVDVTFVDENDVVRFFSATKERIFQREPAIIGRRVQQCHPPASVHRVQRILDDFRTGRRDVAEFWIQMGPKFIHIRYFAVRDAAGKYLGTLEVTQDVAAIRALQGERRLLEEGT